MSFWQRVRGALRGASEADTETAAASPTEAVAGATVGRPAAPAGGNAAPGAPEETLRAMATDPRLIDELAAVAALERLEAEGRAGTALSLAAAVLAHGARLPRLRLAMAETHCARAQDAEAQALLAPLVAAATFDELAAQLSAEIHERAGRVAEARRLYEAILARDVGHVHALSRLARLAERERQAGVSGGATLAAEGAMAQGRYRIERELGRGGAGTVFLARDVRLGRQVALKIYHRRGRAEWERLLVEARTPARIEHPLVCRVLDLDAALYGLALEYLPAGSVRGMIERGGYDVQRASAVLESAAEGLEAVHAAGFVHRDVKPSNLLLRRDGRAVLTDFGIALPRGAAPTGPAAEGTRQYMAPEQAESKAAAPPADVYALGRAARELYASAQGELPPELVSLWAATTRRDPTQRPSLGEIRAALAPRSDS